VEIEIPFADFGGAPQPGDAWGFNVCREAPSTGELSMWTDTGGRFTRVRGLADLVFVPAVDRTVEIDAVKLEEKTPGTYVLRGNARSERARSLTFEVHIQSPENLRTTASGAISLAAGAGTFAFPVEFRAEAEGEAKLWFFLKDAGSGALVAYRACNFNVLFPSTADLGNLVLVPTPKELTRADGLFPMTADTVIWVGDGKRDRFAGGVLRGELQQYYGIAPCVRGNGTCPAEDVVLVGGPDT